MSDQSDIVIRTQGFISSVTPTAADIEAITWGRALVLWALWRRGSTTDPDTTTTPQSVREQSDKDSDTIKEVGGGGGISMQQMLMTLWHRQVTKQTDWFVAENEEE